MIIADAQATRLVKENDSTSIECSIYSTIRIRSASYFSTESDCKKDVQKVLKNKCNNKVDCSIKASNTVLGGDPCVGENKKLSFTFDCVE
jgi:hypothetical protein